MRLSYAVPRRRAKPQTEAVKATATPNAPSGAENPIPSASTRPGKGRRADRVREERQAAQHDPGAEDTGADAENEYFDQAPLDEGQLERLEHLAIPSGRPMARYSIGASSASQSSLLANFVSLVPWFVARNA